MELSFFLPGLKKKSCSIFVTTKNDDYDALFFFRYRTNANHLWLDQDFFFCLQFFKAFRDLFSQERFKEHKSFENKKMR